MNKNTYSFVIFDWDGTLMDSTAKIYSNVFDVKELLIY